jgi:uncharacterized membrane protein YfcA
MFELSLGIIIVIVSLAFLCEYMDSTLEMGYGTTFIPVLLMLCFTPLQIVPAVLLSELFSGLLVGFFHHLEGNVNLKPVTTEIFRIKNILSPLCYIDDFNKTVPIHLKVALLLSALIFKILQGNNPLYPGIDLSRIGIIVVRIIGGWVELCTLIRTATTSQ